LEFPLLPHRCIRFLDVCGSDPRNCLPNRPRADTKAQVYRSAFATANAELANLGLRPLQLGVDHFGGIAGEVAQINRECRCVTSIWHLKRNLMNNGAPKKHKQHKVQRLVHRSPRTVVAYVLLAASLPSPLMFHFAMSAMLARVKGWGDTDWATYFQNTYLERRTVNGTLMWTAKWWFEEGVCGVRRALYGSIGPVWRDFICVVSLSALCSLILTSL